MEMEAFTGKLHAYLRSVSTRVRIHTAAMRACRPTPPSPNCTTEVSQPSALACEANTEPRLVLLLVQIEELHTRVDKLDDRLTGNLKEQSDSFAATAKGLDERLSRGVQVR